MTRRNSKLYSFILMLVDALTLVTAFVLAYIIRVIYDPRPLIQEVYAQDYLISALLIVPFWVAIFGLVGLYQPRVYSRRLLEWSKIAIGVFIGILFVIGWEYVSDRDIFPARLVAVYALIGTFVLVVIEREVMRLTRTLSYRYGRGIRRVLIIGSSGATRDIARSLVDTRNTGHAVIAIAGPKRVLPESVKALHFTQPEKALEQIKELGITTIIQTDLYEDGSRNQAILNAAQVNHIDYNFIPSESEFYSGKNTVDIFLGYPMITVYQTPLVGWGSIIKRIFDLFAATLLILILSPVFAILMLLQKILNPGPIFYASPRLSRYSKMIPIIKFRSMSSQYTGKDPLEVFKAMNRDDLVKEYSESFKVEDDPRVTRFGKFLRKSSLDELPQLFNVWVGHISLVGPRPIPLNEFQAKFNQEKGALLLSIKSGLTGLWQVSGRSDLTTEQRIKLELYYVQNWTFWLDLKILLKTVWVVIRGVGAK